MAISLAAATFAVAGAARAQFAPGPNPISGLTTTPETLSSGTGNVAAGGALVVNNTSPAVTLSGTGTTLIVSGTVQQTGSGDRAVLADGSNVSIQVLAGGLINSSDPNADDAIHNSKGTTSITITNSGTISVSGSGGQAIDLNNITKGANTVNNSGLVTSYGDDAVRPGVNGVVINSGTISATAVNNSSSDGVDAQKNSGVQITNNGLISGGRHGITGGLKSTDPGNGVFSMSLTNNAGATLQGNNGSGINIDGFNSSETVTIVNNGTISGNGVSGDGDGVDVDGLVNLTNTGTIVSLNAYSSGATTNASEGVTVGGGTILNSGTIEGETNLSGSSGPGIGITLAGIDVSGTQMAIYANSAITNSGLIKGQTSSAIAIALAASGLSITITNQAGGVIEGSGTTAAIQTGGDGVTVFDSGKIMADGSGNAIAFAGGSNSLQVTGGVASILGNISGAVSGTNTLSIVPGAGNTFQYAGNISTFNSVTTGSGTTVFTGSNSYQGATVIAGGTLQIDNNGTTTAGKLGGTASIAVNTGGTLLFSGSGSATRRINAGASVALGGGRISFGGLTGASEAAGALTLSANSALDFGSGNGNSLTFSTLALGGKSLTVNDWTGQRYSPSATNDPGTDLTQDRLLFTTNPSASQLSQISFYNSSNAFIGTGQEVTFGSEFEGSEFEVVPVPEPSTILAGVGLLALLGVRERRRWLAVCRKRPARP